MTENVKNDKPKKRDQTAKKIIRAIKEAKGYLTTAADIAGVSWKTVYRYVNDYSSVRQAVEEADERENDFTENKLHEKIESGDTACIIFRLKTKAKHRGYVERQEQEHVGEVVINVRRVDRSKKENI